MSRKQPGLHGRHGAVNGRIEPVSTLRQAYGDAFALGFRSDAQLSTVLRETGNKSLSQLLKDSRGSD